MLFEIKNHDKFEVGINQLYNKVQTIDKFSNIWYEPQHQKKK